MELLNKQIYSATLAEIDFEKNPKMPLAVLTEIVCDGKAVSDRVLYPFWGAIELSGINPGSRIKFAAKESSHGLAQVCWVQADEGKFKVAPAHAIPESKADAEWFLSRRMKIAEELSRETVSQWGIRIQKWDENSVGSIKKLVDAGYCYFSNSPESEFVAIFDELAEHYRDRDICRLAEIAAWCNAGCPVWDFNPDNDSISPDSVWAMQSGASYEQ